LVQGVPLHTILSNTGVASFYAPAISGLGAGSDWSSYTATLTSTQSYTLTLTDAIVTVNDTDVYTGDFTLVVTGTTTIEGAGHTAAPNFADAAYVQTEDAQVTLGPATGTFLVGGEPVDASNGLALAGYTGPITVTAETATLDRVELDGEADFFTLDLSPETSSTDPNTPVTFQAQISSNFTDTYTMTVEGPQGWDVEMNAGGLVTATPPLGAEPGGYTLLVTAQSGTYPDLFLSAQHSVTTTAYAGMEMDVAYDELITVPMGEVLNPDALPGDTNSGQAQVPQAAYTVNVTNTSTSSHTFGLVVTPTFPADWLVLSADELTLPAGGVAQVGLYVSPTVSGLLSPGASYPFDVAVAASDGSGLEGTDAALFTMPAVPFNYLQAEPERIYASPGVTASFDLILTNVGNAAGTFAVTATLPLTTWTGSAPYSAALGPGDTDTRASVFTPTGSVLGDWEIIHLDSPAPGSAYTQTEYVAVQLAGPCVVQTQQAAVASMALDDAQLTTSLDNLTFQLGRWELDESDATLQSQTVAALDDLIARLAAYPLVDTTGLQALAAAPSVAGFCSPMSDLADKLARIAARRVSVAFSPGSAAALLGQPVTYTLELQNQGTTTTTYEGNLQIGNGQISNLQSPFTITLSPGQASPLPLVITPTVLGYNPLQVQVQAVEDSFIQAQASAGLKVVDSLLRVLEVRANPAFVEVGAGSTDLSARLANTVYQDQPATAHVSVTLAGGSQVWSDQVALNVLVGGPRAYALGQPDTSGWAAGTYTVGLELRDAAGELIPGGQGHGYLLVGQGMGAAQSISPTIAPPGTITATIQITTQVQQGNPVSWLASDNTALAAVPRSNRRTPGLASLLRQGPVGIERFEDDALDATGSWYLRSANPASGGYYRRSATLGNTLGMTFTGTWAGVGFIGSTSSGLAHVQIDDGATVSETVDLYSLEVRSIGRYYAGLSSGNHVITVTVLGQRNPLATSNYVNVDFVDTWDGASMNSAGTFEAEDDPFLGQSRYWSLRSDSAASGGYYVRNSYAYHSLWFPFTGSSITYQAVADDAGGRVRLSLDGEFLADADLYHPSSDVLTRSFDFDGLGDGPHVLQVENLWLSDYAYADAFTTPSAGTTLTPSGVLRLEENDPALRFDGLPYLQSDGSWEMSDHDPASAGHVVGSETQSDTLSLTFEHDWVGVGFYTGSSSGQVQVRVDDGSVVSETLDLYSAIPGLSSRYYSLPTGTLTHTLCLTVLGTHSAASSGDWVSVDSIDTWSGAPLPAGRYQEHASPVLLSHTWEEKAATQASDGLYLDDAGAVQNNLWFGFTGDSVTYLAMSQTDATDAEVFIDGQSQGSVDQAYLFPERLRAFHYDGLGDGPHVLRVKAEANATVDAFETPMDPSVDEIAVVEWYDSAPGGGSVGVMTSAAAADLTGDGVVEVAVTSFEDETLYVYRGDGADAGEGTPLLWSATVGVANAPALADLDGDGDGEIVVASDEGLYAFYHDGTSLWFTSTVKSYWMDPLTAPSGGTAIGNMDQDDAPELVVGGYDGLYVVEADGSVAWHYSTVPNVLMTPPLLADLTGDGQLDILAAWDNDLYLFDYAGSSSPVMTWTHSVTAGLKTWGAPAVANLDGEPGPEIVMAWDGYVELLDSDGSLLWSYSTGGTKPGSVSVADTDGDDEMEIIVSMRVENTPSAGDYGRVFVLDGDGSLLWSAPSLDDTTSSSGVSVHDLDGDGAWEIIWNGYNQGLTIYRGSDGAVLFNEPLINSHTMHDYPIVADVDGDDHAEIVTGDAEGLYVVGLDAAWAPARPMWNQYNYHITNVADDLQVPPHEPHSWTAHNTYRTQTPQQNPASVYQVDLTYTGVLSGAQVLSDTLVPTPTSASDPDYFWHYQQFWYEARQVSLAARLEDVQPGELRPVSQGTLVSYTHAGGHNELLLPPLYVQSPRAIAIAPSLRRTNPGGYALYDVGLFNPGDGAQTFDVQVNGLPSGWQASSLSVSLVADETTTYTLVITAPLDAAVGDYDFVALLETSAGWTDAVQATVCVSDLMHLDITPASAIADYDQVVSYTLSLVNQDSSAHDFSLSLQGLEAAHVDLPANLYVGAQSTATLPFSVTARAAQGLYPLDVYAETTWDDGLARLQAGAALVIASQPAVAIALQPSAITAGQASPGVFTVTVTNTGTLSDNYTLSVSLPSGWSAGWRTNDLDLQSPTSNLSLTPYVFNAAQVQLLVTPPDGTTATAYPVGVSAVSTQYADVSASDSGTVNVSPQGVRVAINPVTATVHPQSSPSWNVTITNTGYSSDTFDLLSGGIIPSPEPGQGSSSVQFSTNPVSLAADTSTVVQLTAQDLDFALAQTYPFAVQARSQATPDVLGYDTAEITFLGFEDVAVSITPTLVTLTDTTVAHYLALITNTGNLDTVYGLSAGSDPQVNLELEIDELYIPPHMTAGILLTARATANGTYPVYVQADSTSGPASDVFTATLVVENISESPLVEAGPDQNVNEGQSVSFSGLITDPDSPSGHTILWTFGDGATASGTLTPVHTYDDDGTYPVTLTVTDTSGLDGSDSLSVNVANVAPSVSVTAVLTTAQVNQLITFTGSFSDPGLADTHVLTWTFGDTSSPLEGSEGEPITHSYSAPGVYTATLSVRDDDGGLGTDAVVIHVSPGGPARDVAVTFAPGAAIALPDQPLTYTLDVENGGYLTTTYVVSLTGLPDGWSNWTQQNVNLAPETSADLALVVTPTALGYYTLHAHVQAVEDEAVWATADAGLNVVEALVRVLSVSANPSFVESGAGTTTSLSVEVANVANVYREVTARARALNAGGTQVWSADLPLALRTGAARSYSLGTVDASAWAAGVYTLSVELLDGDSARVPDGFGYGYLGVDQALQGTHSVNPATINGDAITATIAITTEISESASGQISESANQRMGEWASQRIGEWTQHATRNTQHATRPPGLASFLFQGGSGVVRYEENDAQVVVSGSWSTCLSSWTAAKVGSASSCRRSDTLSSTLGLTFTGTWAGVGFIADAYSGLARVQIDGGALLSETVDLYSNETRSVSRYYSVPSGTHFIRVVVLDQRNPLSAGDRVYMDFVDTWDGASMSTGTFEAEDDPFLGQSKNWNTLSAAVASDGAYLYNFYAHRSLWFPFTGDSCTYQALANENGDLARLSLDGAYLGHVDLFHPGSELVTRTFSFDHLGDGPHVLQVENLWDGHYTYADAFITPGTASSPLTPTGVVRLEENDPTLRFDGRPFYQSDGSWDVRDYDQASAGHTVRSETSGDELSLTFQSDWLGVGFYTDDDSGRVRLLVDDGATVSETLDLYSASPDVSSHYYSLPTGTLTHTLRLLVLGEHNASSSGDWVEVDLVDLWTGNPLPSDRYEEDAPSVFLSHNWREVSDARASGGRYLDDVIPNQSNLWFGFTGDSITLLALTHSSASEAEVLIDGQSQGAIDQAYAFTPGPRPFHYSGLGDGPHVLQVKATSNTTVDAFDVPLNPSAGVPAVEWYDEAPGWGTGVEATAAAADLDDDGDVEIVVSAVDEVLYVYQGDGTDTGLGSALLWTATVGVASAPAVVELDGTPGAEIVVASDEGLYAWHHDGTSLWFTDTLKSYWPLLLVEPAGGVAVANLDSEATPEIVVGGYDGLYVVEADGSIAWHYATADDVRMTPPLLADVSGDGQLDILAGWDNNLYLFDYAHQPAPALVWTRTVTNGLDTWGAPAVADLDGDAAPEIAMAWDGYVELLEADGSLAWSYSTGGTKPGSVAIADTDGDEDMEIIVSMRVEITPTSGTYGRVFVLNADGSLLWSAPAHDDTGSSSGVSVHDLDGDGLWEVIWNGYGQGLTIYRGSDGAVLFNEPLIQSYTMHDYPIVADVDGDDHVEIVTGDTEGLYVIGFDAAWGPARPLWNQYNYHITNVADDLQVPPDEPDSWTAHNTYRTQTPEQNPAPVYPLALTHTLALSDVMVLSDTWSAPPGGVAPTLYWTYGQFWYEAAHRTSLDVRLPDLHPGQVRQVSQGSEATAWLPDGTHGLTLPPLYLESPHVVALEPPDQTLNPGGCADYVVSLYNPAPHSQTYTLTVVGLPGGFQAPGRVLNVPAGATLTATLPLTAPFDAALGQYAWMAVVQTADGEQDAVQATLTLSDPLAGWPEGDDYRPRAILTWAERGTLASARLKRLRYGMSW
jgi:uncharacterized membrane protein